jgi:hypothetical protein
VSIPLDSPLLAPLAKRAPLSGFKIMRCGAVWSSQRLLGVGGGVSGDLESRMPATMFLCVRFGPFRDTGRLEALWLIGRATIFVWGAAMITATKPVNLLGWRSLIIISRPSVTSGPGVMFETA